MASITQTDGKGMDTTIEQVSGHVQVVPEEAIRQICKGPLVKFAQECEDELYEYALLGDVPNILYKPVV